MSIHFVFGGARSGKSAYAEKLAIASNLPVTYIATAQVYDDEFRQRIAHHQARRPAHWQLIEEPHFLSDALEANTHAASRASKNARAVKCIIIDCLTLWLAQCICADCVPPECRENIKGFWANEREKFLALLPTLTDEIILVSNEVGMGIVPLGEINRQFQDEQGRLNQAIAAIADKVTMIAAGLPLTLKG